MEGAIKHAFISINSMKLNHASYLHVKRPHARLSTRDKPWRVWAGEKLIVWSPALHTGVSLFWVGTGYPRHQSVSQVTAHSMSHSPFSSLSSPPLHFLLVVFKSRGIFFTFFLFFTHVSFFFCFLAIIPFFFFIVFHAPVKY